jgi:hypothetical protein
MRRICTAYIDDSGKISGIEIDNALKSQTIDIASNCDPSIQIEQTLAFMIRHMNVEPSFQAIGSKLGSRKDI